MYKVLSKDILPHLSSADIDSRHTTALREREQVAFQTRKMRKTTNEIYLTDRQGLPLIMSTPIASFINKDMLLDDFETTISNWKAFNYIAFMVIFFKKIKQNEKSR